MDNNYQANNSKCKCCKGIVKQQILNQPKFKIEEQITYECQPMLNRHQQCNQFCLNFTKRISISKEIHLQFPKVQPMSLKDSKLFVLKLVDLNQEIKDNKKKMKKIKKFKRRRAFKFASHKIKRTTNKNGCYNKHHFSQIEFSLMLNHSYLLSKKNFLINMYQHLNFERFYQHQIFDIEFLLSNLSSSLTKMEKEER